MADDLVVQAWAWGVGFKYGDEHNALARAYLERDAQLAKAQMWRTGLENTIGHSLAHIETLEAQLAAMTAERNNWRDLYSKDLIRANEDKDALQAQLTASENAERVLHANIAAVTIDRDGCRRRITYLEERLKKALAETAEKGKSNGV